MKLSDLPTIEECLRRRELLAGLIGKYDRAGSDIFFGWELLSPECVARLRMDVLSDLHAQDAELVKKILSLGVKDDT